MTINEKNKETYQSVNFLWFVVMVVSLFFIFMSLLNKWETRYIYFLTFILSFLFKAIINARYNYRKALKGKLLLGGKIADSMFIIRKYLKIKKEAKQKI